MWRCGFLLVQWLLALPCGFLLMRCGFLLAVLSGVTCAVVHHPALRASRGSDPARGGPRTRADRPAPGWSKAPHSNRLGPCFPGQGRIRGGFKHNPLPSPPTEPRSKVGSNNASWLILANPDKSWSTCTTCFGIEDGRPWPACNAQVCAGVRGRWLCLNTPVPAG